MEDKLEMKKDQMPKQSAPNTNRKHVERVILNDKSTSKLTVWLSMIEKNHRGIKVSRNDLVNFVLAGHPSELSENEITQLKTTHFDPIRFSKWITESLKKAKARGENPTQEELLRLFTTDPGENR